MFSLLPISPILLLGVNDTIIYRKMLDHRVNISESVFTVARELTQSTSSSGSGNGSEANNNSLQNSSLFNYGLLTAVHVLPGFASFVGMRLLAWLLFGSSNHRKHQIYRRKDVSVPVIYFIINGLIDLLFSCLLDRLYKLIF